MSAKKDYLGDSVYADIDCYTGEAVKLTTENGMGPSNTIILEREVLRALVWYYLRVTDTKLEDLML